MYWRLCTHDEEDDFYATFWEKDSYARKLEYANAFTRGARPRCKKIEETQRAADSSRTSQN
ncbi:unnamed protein product, partial [Amoebophrya sp. A25]|eukprot:GSA25T00015852001.1